MGRVNRGTHWVAPEDSLRKGESRSVEPLRAVAGIGGGRLHGVREGRQDVSDAKTKLKDVRGPGAFKINTQHWHTHRRRRRG